MLSPTASTNPSRSVITPGLRLPRRQPLYSWQFTRSRPTFSQPTMNNSSPCSKTPSTTPKQSRSVRPGTLTKTELLGYPSRPLRWLSPLTQTTFPSSSQPSSCSQSGSRSKKATQANRYTQCLNCYRFGHAHARCTQIHPTCPYCALHHTHSAHRCQNPTCPKGGDTKAVSGCCPTSPPHCPNCGDDHDAFSREYRARPVPPRQPEAPPTPDEELSDASSDTEEVMDVGDDGHLALATSETPSKETTDTSTPRPLQQTRDAPAPPSGSQPAPTGWGLPPVTPPTPSGSSQK